MVDTKSRGSAYQIVMIVLGLSFSSLLLHGVSGCAGTDSSSATGTSLIVYASPSPGPSYIPVGGTTLQYYATQVNADGTTEDVSSSATWASSNATSAPISTAGKVTSGTTGGVSTITATVGSLTGTASLKVTGLVKTISLSAAPYGAWVRPNSTEVWVPSNGSTSVFVIDTTTNTVTNTISLGAGYNANGMAFLPDGSKAYVITTSTNAVKVINASTKAISSTIALSGPPQQIAVSPSGTTAIVSVQTGTPALKQITTSTDTLSTFSSTPTCPTGVAFLSSGALYVSDQCHGPDWIYVYANYPATTSTNFAGSTSWVANRIYASPNGSRLVAPPGGGGGTLMVQTSNNSILQTISSPATLGDTSFFSDNKRLIGYQGTVYKIHDYSGTSITLLDSLSYTNAGTVIGITSDQTLYLPTSGNTITVYQYY